MMDKNSSKQSASGTVEYLKGDKCIANKEDEMFWPEIKKVRMRARAYKALFQKQEKKVKVSGQVEELDGSAKSFHKDGSNCGDHTQKESTAAGEICHITGDDCLSVQEANEVICEEESTQMRQKFDHNFQFRSSPKSVDMDRSDDPRRVGGISLSLVGGAHKNEVLKEQVYAVTSAVVDIDKDNTPICSTGHKENHVGETSGLNIGTKSGEPEAGIYFQSCEKSATQLPNLSLDDTQGNDCAVDPEQLFRLPAAVSKENSSQFIEFWVPAQMSHVQLEKYCSTLVNSLPLRSPSRTDPVGALHDVLTTARKCCDHPYLVDSTLQNLLTKDLQPTQVLDIGIQASGKLELLDKILVEMRTRGLRTLILFQNIGSFREKDSITVGDILDDAVRRRFGEKSYERVDWGLARPKIQTALSNFNNKELGRFVFLIEGRACRPIIRLSSVDVVVIFGSDWQPGNDIRNLQKMTLEPASENIKVFRLYSCFTVEEKVLISSRKGVNLDGRVQDRTPNICHMLLMWEAAYLFKQLNEFHCSYSESSHLILSDSDNTKSVVKELLSFLPVEENNLRSSSVILRVESDGSSYQMDFPLYGESKSQSAAEQSLSPPKFWTKLLEGKHPQWKYSSGSSQRNRRRNIHSYGNDADEVAKKRKLANNSGVQSPKKRGKCKITGEKGPSGSPPILEQHLDNHTDGSAEAIKLCDSLKILRQSLQLGISRLCEVLNLGDKVKNIAQKFLDYIIHNHHVTQKPVTIVQAFQLALCWTAASMLKVKVDHKESLQLVKTHLSYVCKEEEADLLYEMLHNIMKMFLEQRRSDMRDVEDLSLTKEDVSIPDNSAEEGISKAIKKIKQKYEKQMEKLMQQQKKKIDEVRKAYEAGKATLQNKHRIEAAIIRLHREGPTRTNMLNTLEKNITGRIEQSKNLMTAHLNQLDRAYHASRTKLHLKEASSIKLLKEWAQTELVDGENAQTSAGSNIVDRPDYPRDVNVCNLPESDLGLSEISEAPCNASVSSACGNIESFSEWLVDQDPENNISMDPSVEENIVHAVNSSVVREEVSLDSPVHSASCTNDQVNLIPQAGEISPSPNGKGICSHSDTVENQIPERTIADETTEIIVADDFTFVVEKDISGTPKNQASHPKEFGDRTSVQTLATSPQCASVSTALPEEPHDQTTESCTSRTMQEKNASSIDQLNAPVPVSPSSDATPPAQCDSGAADAELTPSVPDLSPVNGTSHVSSVQATRPFEEFLEPQMNSVQGIPNHPPASGHGIHPPGYASTPESSTPESSFPPAQTSLLLSSGMSDPLQTEIEQIQSEVDLEMRNHEDLKRQLKLECEKEIERTVSQIRHKYKAKEQEAEADYTLKKKDLEANFNKVHMNKILAAAFMSKCMHFRAAESPYRADAFSNLQQQMMLSQPNPASSPCIPSTPRGTLRPSPALSCAQTSTTRQSVNPVLPLHQSTPHASIPRRPPPVVGQFTTPVNVQVRQNVCRPAPHLQSFRPSPFPSRANPPPRGMFPSTSYHAGGLSPSTTSHCPDYATVVGPFELPRGQQNSMWQSQHVSSTNIIDSRSMREHAAVQIVCVSDDDE